MRDGPHYLIEIDFSGIESQVHQVTYVDELRTFGHTLLTLPSTVEVLSCKTTHWSYEAEYRIIHEADYYSIKNRIKAIYAGTSISKPHLELLQKITAEKIPIFTTKMNLKTIKIEKNKLVERFITTQSSGH